MKIIVMSIIMLAFVSVGIAQTGEDSVKAAVNLLFDGMKTSDAAKIQSAFADSAILQTIFEKDGVVTVKNELVKDFAASVSKISKGDADERIQFETIRIDGPLASVWTPYKFYYKGKFLHCGVDAYHLVRIGGQWKIQYLIDTRRKQPCD